MATQPQKERRAWFRKEKDKEVARLRKLKNGKVSHDKELDEKIRKNYLMVSKFFK